MNNSINSGSWTEHESHNNKYPGPLAAGIFFSLTTVLLTYGDSLLNFNNNFLKSGVGEVLFVLLPVLVFLIAGRYNIRDTLKLRKTKPINYLIVVFLMLFGMPVVGVLNAIVLVIIRLVFGKNLPIPQIDIPDIPTLFIAILVIGISAAVCEEILFRGVISKSFDRYGTVQSIAVTSVLFGILHRDIQKGVSTILLGALIGFIVYRTGSIYAGMTAHFTNNTAAVLLTYGTSRMSEKLKHMGLDQAQGLDYFANLPTSSLIIVIIFYAIMFIGFTVCFIALLYAFYKSTTEGNTIAMAENCNIETAVEQTSSNKPSRAAIIALLPGLFLILLTFTGQFLSLMNVKSGIIYNLLKFLGI